MNILEMMKTMKDLPAQAQKMQERMKGIEVTADAGGGLVQVRLDGTFEVLSVKISPTAVDKRDVEALERLVMDAFQNAGNQIRQKLQENMPTSF